MAKVRALSRGYCGHKVREPGEVFQFDGHPAHWFEFLDKKEYEKAKKNHPELDEAKQVKMAKPKQKEDEEEVSEEPAKKSSSSKEESPI